MSAALRRSSTPATASSLGRKDIVDLDNKFRQLEYDRVMALRPKALKRRAIGCAMPANVWKRADATPKPLVRSVASRNRRDTRRSAPKSISLGGLTAHLGYYIRRVQIWVFQDFIRTLKDLDLSPAQYSVLWAIDANAGLSQTELARALGIQRARLVRMLHRLDRRGLTRRMQSSDDGRTHALRLTPQGQETLRRAIQLAAQHEARLIDKLGTEQHREMMNMLREF